MKLHPLVRETLDSLKAAGITLVAHTESKLYGVVDRLNRLELTNYFAKVYCRERSIFLGQGTISNAKSTARGALENAEKWREEAEASRQKALAEPEHFTIDEELSGKRDAKFD